MKLLCCCLALIHASAFAQLGEHEQKGLKDTQDFLKNKKERQQFIDKDAKAKDVDNKVDALAGSPQNKEEIYSISADIIEKLVMETKGDAAAMQKILEQAQKDPQAFYQKYFDEKSKARVRGLATDIEKKGTAGPSKK